MPSPTLKYSILAAALLQAFAAQAQSQSQSLPEVVVTGHKFVPLDRAGVAGFSDAPLLKTPASVTAFGREQLQDLNIRSTTDALRFEASVAESYNAVGYAEQFSIRGFALDNNTSYRKDGIAISADTQIPLENKERIEILKGLAGLQAGVASPGGLVNYVTKRPTNTPLRSVTVEARERGTLYGAVDLGGRFEDKRFGYRINAAGERLRSYVRGADGERQFVSGAFDWQITPEALLQIDADYQKKSQITAPGYQLIRGTDLPHNVSPKTLLNDQPWAKPVDTTSSNVALRFQYQLSDGWRATLSANRHSFKRDDYTAFPYGCSNEGDGFYPGYCSNGDYDVYDYQSVGESKNPLGWQAQVQGKAVTGAITHELTFGASGMRRTDRYGDYVYDYAGYSNIYHNLVTPPAPGNPHTGPVFDRRHDDERAVYLQDIVGLSSQVQLHAGLRHVLVKRDNVTDTSFLLPNVALTYAPNQDWMLYGSLAHGMEHGGTAPMQTVNENQTLDPMRSKQVELGVKGVVGDDLSVAASLFQIRQGLEYTNAANVFVRSGERTHRGIEVSAQGGLSADLKYSVSLIGLDTDQAGTGDASIDGKHVTNVPAFKSVVMLDYLVPSVPGLKVQGTWQYSARKAFDVTNSVYVPGYHVFGLGSSYAAKLGGVAATVRFNVDNVTDKFYWRDVTPQLGGYLFPGAPRTFRLSAQFDF
ncbi:MAG: TonB-dependent siderophore receptor [Gammaproteobacteria bacterium]